VAGDDEYAVSAGTVLGVEAPGVLSNDSDADGDALTAVPVGDVEHGVLELSPDGSFTYTPEGGYEGTDSFTYRASDGGLQSGEATVTLQVEGSEPSLKFEVGTAEGVGGDWQSVELVQAYISAVVACAVEVEPGDGPLLVRVRGAAGGSFEVRLASPGGVGAVPTRRVHYVAVEEGVWTLPDGRALEASRIESAEVNSRTDWSLERTEPYSYGQAYASPVVLGQVMTAGEEWSAFWCGHLSRQDPPDGSACRVGRHVGEDPQATRGPETLGVIVIESGAGTVAGVAYEAGVGADVVQGVGNAPPYVYPLSAFSSAPQVAVATQAGMDGQDGAWSVLWGPGALAADGVSLAAEEDALGDGERGHTTEQVGYLVFEEALAYAETGSAPVARPDWYATGREEALAVGAPGVLSNDEDADGDALTAVLTADASHGTLALSSEGSFDYAPDGGYEGFDRFRYRAVAGGQESGETTVTIQVGTAEASLKLETGTAGADGGWGAVALRHQYVRPVVVCAVERSANAVPVLARVRGAAGGSFELRLESPGGAGVVPETVHYVAVEEGVWTLPDGRALEASRIESDEVNSRTDWDVARTEAYAYGQSYSSPVVLGQVMTAGDEAWSAFWCGHLSRQNPPDGAVCRVGRHVGEDPQATRGPETLGLIVIESGTGTVAGVPYEAGLGADVVKGADDAPPYTYALSAFGEAPQVGVATQGGMDGQDGAWTVLWGPGALTAGGLAVSADEDTLGDGERNHTTEQVGYLVFGEALAYEETGMPSEPPGSSGDETMDDQLAGTTGGRSPGGAAGDASGAEEESVLDAAAPRVGVLWPAGGLTGERFVTVRGVAEDESAVEAVWVGGVRARATSPHYATWEATVPLSQGRTAEEAAALNRLAVSATDEHGNFAPLAAVCEALSVGAAGRVRRVPLGTRYAGALVAGDADTFQFEATAGTTLDVSLEARGGGGFGLELRDPWGERIELPAECVAAGDGSLKVTGCPLPATGLWTLSVEPAGGECDYALELGGTVPRAELNLTATLSGAGDADAYALEAVAGSVLTAQLTGEGLEPVVEVLDPTGRPVAPAGRLVVRDGRAMLKALPLELTGRHVVRAVSAGGSGRYRLTCSVRPPGPAGLRLTAPRIVRVRPESVAAGGVLELTVVGADAERSGNLVEIGGRAADVTAARLRTGRGAIEVRVPAGAPAGEAAVRLSADGEKTTPTPLTITP
jgi:hypothetical protein